jgi:hypothetical protein
MKLEACSNLSTVDEFSGRFARVVAIEELFGQRKTGFVRVGNEENEIS